MQDVRAEALSILEKVETRHSYAGRLLDDKQRYRDWPAQQLAFLRQLVKGTLQWRGRIDALLEELVTGGMARLEPQLRNVLRLAAYQILYLDNIPAEVTVDQTVETVKGFGHKGMAGLANAVLRKVAARRETLRAEGKEAKTADEIAAACSHPLWIVQKWFEVLGPDETRALCEANNARWPLCLRTNTLKTDTPQLRRMLSESGLSITPAGFHPDCTLLMKLPAGMKLTELETFNQGMMQTQDESSTFIGALLDPKPGETVLDLCSAPGGKTVHMAALMQNQGRLLALDPFANRLRLVHENCQRLGISCVEIYRGDGRSFIPDAQVDAILVDAPCSGLGAIGRRSDMRWNKSEDDIPGLLELQMSLLEHAASLLAPGGRLVYSTCTTNPDENEGIVLAFLTTHPEFQKKEAPATFPRELLDEQGFFRSWPQRHKMGGAFGALLQRM